MSELKSSGSPSALIGEGVCLAVVEGRASDGGGGNCGGLGGLSITLKRRRGGAGQEPAAPTSENVNEDGRRRTERLTRDMGTRPQPHSAADRRAGTRPRPSSINCALRQHPSCSERQRPSQDRHHSSESRPYRRADPFRIILPARARVCTGSLGRKDVRPSPLTASSTYRVGCTQTLFRMRPSRGPHLDRRAVYLPASCSRNG